jgi:serine/threonine protein kinase
MKPSPEKHSSGPGLKKMVDEVIDDLEPVAGKFRYRPGSLVGNYKILKPLGHGGFGEIWWAEQREPVRRHVALKLVKLGMDTDKVLRRFQKERQALAAMEHPNVAKLLDAGSTPEGYPYFAMELVRESAPITQFCQQQHLPLHTRLDLFLQVCAGVHHAHQKGVIHRDLKPSNLLVSSDGQGRPQVKVIDFGIAKLLTADMLGHTQTVEHGLVAGTPEYMAPEQMEPEIAPDPRTDVFALGAILYEILAGRPALDAARARRASSQELIDLLREHTPVPPSEVLARLSPEKVRQMEVELQGSVENLRRQCATDLDWVVIKAMSRERKHRYASVKDLAEDITHFLHGTTVQARPATLIYHVQKFMRRRQSLILTLTVFTPLLIAGTAVCTWLAVRADRAEQSAETTRQSQARSALARALLQAGQKRAAEPDNVSVLALIAGLHENLAREHQHGGDHDSALLSLEEACRVRAEIVRLQPKDEQALRDLIAARSLQLGLTEDNESLTEEINNLEAKRRQMSETER